MLVELIPVIKIGSSDKDITPPNQYPYWENSDIWDEYYQECYKREGFKDIGLPYLRGSIFFKLTDISDDILTKLVAEHTQGMRNGEYTREEGYAFGGGYVLKVNGEDKYFPQCCAELSDINAWERTSNGQHAYHEEHPTPEIIFKDNNVVFDFSREEWELFEPTPPEMILTVDRLALKVAVEKAKAELYIFEERLNKINIETSFNIENIGGLLIWDNPNYN